MAFIYVDRIGEEQVAFANSLGFRDWSNRKYSFTKYSSLVEDKENNMFFKYIGGYGSNYECPLYADLYNKGIIIRMEVEKFITRDDSGKEYYIWDVERTYIPQSVWEQRNEIIKQIRAAMMCNKYNIPTEVNFLNEPEMVEKDYNDK